MSAVTSYINSSDRTNTTSLITTQQQQNCTKSKSFYIENLNNSRTPNQTMKTDSYNGNLQQLHENESQIYFNWASNLNFSNAYAEQINNNVSNNAIQMELEDNELWSRFSNLTNEMILTKAGR